MKNKKLFLILLSTSLAILSTLSFADIHPKNGNWQPEINSYDIKGCPPMMRSAFKKEKLYSKSKKATFSKPFHPNDLFDPKDMSPDGTEDVKWIKINPNEWKTTLHMGQEGMTMDMTWNIKVTSETTMDMNSHFSMNFSKEMLTMMGGASECKVDSSGIIKHKNN